MANFQFKIGIRGHDINGAPFNNIDSFINELNRLNIKYLQLVVYKAFNVEVNDDFLKTLGNKLKENDITVSMVGAYFNMVHPDNEKRLKGIETFKYYMDKANYFDCDLVGSETGSYNGDKWTYHELNRTTEAYLLVRDTVLDLMKYGKNININVIPEGADGHVIYKPSQMKKLIDELDIENVTFDLFNYLNINNYKNHELIFDEAIELFKDKIKIVHMKDFIVKDEKLVQVGIGKGLINFQSILPKIKKYLPNATLILEGVKGDDILPSVEFIRSFE